jgi:anthranilate phosphoribosyltransferase
MVMQEALSALIDEGQLSGELAGRAMQAIMTGEATASQMGAYLGALRVRGESAEVIAASAAVMREHAEPIPVENVIDVVGTGGDGVDTFNVSTAAAIVVAAAGGRVAKHGNRAMSSKTGSADVLESLGARTDLGGAAVARVIEGCGFCFVFAQRFHPAMRHVGPTRREMGVRTLFNLLGPLTNPAKPGASLVGVSSARHASLVAEAFAMRGDRAIVVRAEDGLDEISPAAPTHAWIVENGSVTEQTLQPSDFGVAAHPLVAVAGSDPASNASDMRALFEGRRGAIHDFVVVNAAAALVVAGLAPDFRAGAELATATLASGKPARILQRYVELTQQESPA